MLLKKLKLSKYIPLNAFSIDTIEIDCADQIQILIGDNGSGKTSVLNEAGPLPPVSRLFTKNGSKYVELEHDGNEYKLTTVFSKKAGVHSFIKNNEELNISGNVTMQLELIERYLSYTKTIDDLVYRRYSICDMSIAERKQLLTYLCPATPEFIMKMYKYVAQQVNKLKNQMSLLTQRKADIETKLIPNEELAKLESTLCEKRNEQIHYGNLIFLAQSKLKEIKQKIAVTSAVEAPSLQQMLLKKPSLEKLLISTIDLFSEYNFPRNMPQEDVLEKFIRHLTDQETEHRRSAEHLFSQLLDMQRSATSIDKELDTIKSKLETPKKQTLIRELQKNKKLLSSWSNIQQYVLIPDKDLAETTQAAQTALNELVDYTSSCTKQRWVSPKIYHFIKRTLETYVARKQRLSAQIADAQDNIKRLRQELQSIPTTSVSATICDTCEYKQLYAGKQELVKNRIAQYKKESETYLNTLTLVDTWYTAYCSIWDDVHGAHTCALRIEKYLRGTIFERSAEQLLDSLKKDSTKFGIILNDTIAAQSKRREYEKLKQHILENEALVQALDTATLPTTNALEELLASTLKKKSQLEKEYIRRKQQYDETVALSQRMKTAIDLCDTVLRGLRHTNAYTKYITMQKFYEFYQAYIEDLISTKTTIDKQVYDLTTIIREQHLLRARYDDEINATLSKCQEQYSISTSLEWGLSPVTGMPHRHLIQFTNTLINNVNSILHSVWSYPFVVDLLPDTDLFTCEFTATCNACQHVPFESLSTGQTTMMNFAWDIALIHTLGCNKYPIHLDEIDEGLNPLHKQNLLGWISDYTEKGNLTQLWMVHHDAALHSGFLERSIICPRGDTTLTPPDTNKNVTMTTN